MESTDTMTLMIVGIYLGVGLAFLIIFDMLTGRVRSRLKSASLETRSRLAGAGAFVGARMSVVILLLALWIFWPVVLWGAVRSKRDDGGSNAQTKE